MTDKWLGRKKRKEKNIDKRERERREIHYFSNAHNNKAWNSLLLSYVEDRVPSV